MVYEGTHVLPFYRGNSHQDLKTMPGDWLDHCCWLCKPPGCSGSQVATSFDPKKPGFLGVWYSTLCCTVTGFFCLVSFCRHFLTFKHIQIHFRKVTLNSTMPGLFNNQNTQSLVTSFFISACAAFSSWFGKESSVATCPCMARAFRSLNVRHVQNEEGHGFMEEPNQDMGKICTVVKHREVWTDAFFEADILLNAEPESQFCQGTCSNQLKRQRWRKHVVKPNMS